MTLKDDILEKIAAGFDNSHKLAVETRHSQEYIRRVVAKLAGDGKLEVIREPRGHTYRIPTGTFEITCEFDIGDQEQLP